MPLSLPVCRNRFAPACGHQLGDHALKRVITLVPLPREPGIQAWRRSCQPSFLPSTRHMSRHARRHAFPSHTRRRHQSSHHAAHTPAGRREFSRDVVTCCCCARCALFVAGLSGHQRPRRGCSDPSDQRRLIRSSRLAAAGAPLARRTEPTTSRVSPPGAAAS